MADPVTQEGDPRTLLTYAVLTGLTPLIPVPLVDDLVRAYFRRRLVRSLAASRGRPLSQDAVEALTSDPPGCLLGGCLGQALLYPLRKLFAKIFFFLEWKRALDLTSQTYHYGYLVDCALAEGYLDPASGRSVESVRQAMDEVCREAPIQPVESAVTAAFRQSRSALLTAAGRFARTFRQAGGRPDPARVEAAIGAAEEQEKQEVAGVIEALHKRLQAVPQEHFRRLREQLRARLEGGGGEPT